MDAGFYGKLPSHGDFLRRRTSDAFVRRWDAWLQEGIAASRAALGDRWLDVYLTSPAWRFIAASGACGPAAVIGVMAPSVDRVGRYFPLTVVAELPAHVSTVGAIRGAAAFLDRAERLVIDTLAEEYVDFDAFDTRVGELSSDLAGLHAPPAVVLDPGALVVLDGNVPGRWQLPMASSADLGPALDQLLSQCLGAVYDPLMVWWTEGSAMVEPTCLIGQGLPEAEAYTALLDGSWREHRWQVVPARVTAAATVDDLGVPDAPLSFRSAAASDVGRVRQINQDSFLERTQVGLWIVADGLGGHSDGEYASRTVCDAFADFSPAPSFDDTIEAARGRLQDVNDHLLFGGRARPGVRTGSTVVLLMVRGAECAVLWAGDSRVYRWRNGRLEQLTRDHSGGESGGTGPHDSHAVTRAVGANTALTLDLYRGRTLAGDRFLLCSDGLTRVVSEAAICEWMARAEIRAAVDGLVAATLSGGAPDNVTALVVEAYELPVTAVGYGLPDEKR